MDIDEFRPLREVAFEHCVVLHFFAEIPDIAVPILGVPIVGVLVDLAVAGDDIADHDGKDAVDQLQTIGDGDDVPLRHRVALLVDEGRLVELYSLAADNTAS